MFGEFVLRECGSTGRLALRDMGINGVTVPCRCRCGLVGDGVKVDHGISSVEPLRGDVFWGSSLEVLGFLVHLVVVCWVIGWWVLENGW